MNNKTHSDDQDEIMDTMGLDKKETRDFIDMIQEGDPIDEALDMLDDSSDEPSTGDPYDNDEPL